MERERAEIGLFVTLAEPTQPMIAEAAAAGFYEAQAYKQKFPRIQILTVRGLLEESERPQYVNVDAELGHKRARRETTSHRGHVEMELGE
jgi:site-specific DNA-methyltransferase (adenine-specific)